MAVACIGVLAGTADLDRTSLPGAALGEVPALAFLVHKGEAVEGAHHLALIGVDNTLGVGTLTNQRHKQGCVLIGGVPPWWLHHAGQLLHGCCCRQCCCWWMLLCNGYRSLPGTCCCTTKACLAIPSACSTCCSCCISSCRMLCSCLPTWSGSSSCLCCCYPWWWHSCCRVVHGCTVASKLRV